MPHKVPKDGQPKFKPTTPRQPIGEWVLQLVAVSEDDICRSIGTATLLGHGLALTARHILQQCERLYQFRELSPGKFHGDVDVHAFQFGSGEVRQWKVAAVASSPDSDLAVLQLHGDPAWVKEPVMRLSFVPPQVGSWIAAFGYPGTAEISEDTVIVSPNSHTTMGRVLDVYPFRRDATFGPCFNANVRLDDGMSGAPALDDDGAVCGVASSTIPSSKEGDQHATFFSLLWPLLGLEIDWPWEARPPGTTYRLFDLFAASPVWVTGLERFAFEADGTLTFDI